MDYPGVPGRVVRMIKMATAGNVAGVRAVLEDIDKDTPGYWQTTAGHAASTCALPPSARSTTISWASSNTCVQNGGCLRWVITRRTNSVRFPLLLHLPVSSPSLKRVVPSLLWP